MIGLIIISIIFSVLMFIIFIYLIYCIIAIHQDVKTISDFCIWYAKNQKKD